MDLDSAIQHCEEVAISKTKQVENGDWEKGSSTERDCIACAEEHRQLAEWLKELKEYRKQSDDEELDFVPEHKKIPCTLIIKKE